MNMVTDQIKAGVEAHLNGNLKAAESAYLTALNLDSNNATAHNNLGFIYGQSQRWDEAVLHLKIALDLNPRMSMAHSNLGQVLMNLGSVDEGMNHLEKAVEVDSHNIQAWDNLGRFCLHGGNYERAEYAWLRAINLNSTQAHLLVRLGTAIAAQGRFAEAIDIYQNLLRTTPNYIDAWAQLGVCYFLTKDYGSCQSALKQALRIKPDDHIALRHSGLVFIALGEKQNAADMFERLLTHYPHDTETELDLAVLHLSLQKNEQALNTLQSLYEVNPASHRTIFYLALALRESGKYEQAKPYFNMLAEQDGVYSEKARKMLRVN